MSRWRWAAAKISKQLWARATFIGLLGITTAILAAVVERFIPWELPTTIGADAVDNILGIIASSMLAVTTFSLSVMISAYGSATSNVTPRATKLLIEDSVSQTVLSTFIGSFLFSIVGIIVLKTGMYGERGRFILFIVTIAVIALIVVSLLRWIDHLTRLGRVGETTQRVEDATLNALRAWREQPYLGGSPMLVDESFDRAVDIPADGIGYVQFIDMNALSKIAERLQGAIYIHSVPGAFVFPQTRLAQFLPDEAGDLNVEELQEEIRYTFALARERSFEQDPRFGLAVMSEIGSRALSSAINDPGTVIDVIGRMARLLCGWSRGYEESEPLYPRVHVPPLCNEDIFDDAFALIARDGAALVEVQIRLQKTLKALSTMGDETFRAAAKHQAELALARAEAALTLEADKQRVREIAGLS
ncbi:DUF2254 domain-containing protein [Pseudomonas sp. TTU2014-080ASC]|uniref:DUF2254 domain-containing protein n=1 Tax=Pseudomonas sp. TTU2014-080ASC TaxID=1729724 RepID=UPI0007184732|nr:DUF2254 domain-containing protein [Pseudomonas sp. TTU2014-080ASC]KRW58457.1 hypothetical protein AO726_16570 [Pseudomonas sp. TTU2014-080ASC]